MKHAPRHKSIFYYIILRIFFNYSIEPVLVLSTIIKNYSSKNSKNSKKKYNFFFILNLFTLLDLLILLTLLVLTLVLLTQILMK
jgi:hypothetical protein